MYYYVHLLICVNRKFLCSKFFYKKFLRTFLASVVTCTNETDVALVHHCPCITWIDRFYSYSYSYSSPHSCSFCIQYTFVSCLSFSRWHLSFDFWLNWRNFLLILLVASYQFSQWWRVAVCLYIRFFLEVCNTTIDSFPLNCTTRLLLPEKQITLIFVFYFYTFHKTY